MKKEKGILNPTGKFSHPYTLNRNPFWGFQNHQMHIMFCQTFIIIIIIIINYYYYYYFYYYYYYYYYYYDFLVSDSFLDVDDNK